MNTEGNTSCSWEEGYCPVISVVLPTFNRASMLGRAIESVLAQTWDDLELIVVDDGSSDETAEVVGGFTDKRLRYLRLEDNRGAAFARNRGIKVARGEYLAFQDSDDEWLPHKLSRQMKVMLSMAPEVSVVYTDMLRVGKDETVSYLRAPEVVKGEPIDRGTCEYRALFLGIVAVLMRKSCFDEAGLFDEKFPRFIDLELLTRFSLCFRFHHIPEAMVLYHYSQGISSNLYYEFVARRLMMERYGLYAGGDKRFLAYQHFCMGRTLIGSGQFAEGRRYLLKAFKWRPSDIKYAVHAFTSLLGVRIYECVLYQARKARDSLSSMGLSQ